MDTKASIGEGDVTIILDGREVQLKPTFMAAQTISRMNGGIKGTIEKVLAVDVDTICSVVAIGMGFHGNRRAPQDLPQQIYEAGLTDDSGGIVAQVALYLRVLASGGRMPKDRTEGGQQEDQGNPSQRS